MKQLTLILIFTFSYLTYTFCQVEDALTSNAGKLTMGIRAGAGWSYADEAHLFNTSTSLAIDYHLKNSYYIQFAPTYSWLWKWNEHYLTIPVHMRKRFGEKFSLFAGPALTFDVGYFKDLGLSGGAYYHISTNSSIVISAFTFTLYDYHIDFLYVPVSVIYSYTF